LLASVDRANRRGQLVGAEGLDQELPGAGQHRPAEVVGFALDRHHHDRRARHLGRELLGRLDPVHVRHVDVHQDDVGLEGHRQLDRATPGFSQAHDLHVTFEAKQPRKVVAGLGDVVDDEDADLVCH
jgi:hypothetical protein